jgi:predicted metal-dependent phosphoesterase TrpH
MNIQKFTIDISFRTWLLGVKKCIGCRLHRCLTQSVKLPGLFFQKKLVPSRALFICLLIFVIHVDSSFAIKRWYRGNVHCHTTQSDGDLAPADVILKYKSLGYNFLAVTDHDLLTKVTGSLPSNFLLLPGEEIQATRDVGAVNIKSVIKPTPTFTIQMAVDAINAQNGMAIYNHPLANQVDKVTLQELLQINNYQFIEIYNYRYEKKYHDDLSFWDGLLSNGRKVYGLATDDAHLSSDIGHGWLMVRTSTLRADSIVAAIRKGDFYATNGISLTELKFENNKISVTSSNGTVIEFVGLNGTVLQRVQSSTAVYTFKGDEKYVRANITNSKGQKAWTQPMFYHKEFADDTMPPLPPTHLTMKSHTGTTIALQWQTPDPAADGDVPVQYQIFRDGKFISRTTDTSFLDALLGSGTNYFYQIYSVDDSSNVSVQAAEGTFATMNMTPLTLVKGNLINESIVDIVFSESLDKASAEQPGNYSIGPGINILLANLQTDQVTVRLTTTPHLVGLEYTLTVNNVLNSAKEKGVSTDSKLFYRYIFTISNISRAQYDTARLQIGNKIYLDLDNLFTRVNTGFINALYIRTRNDEKLLTGDNFLSFETNASCYVHVAYDCRLISKPQWLDEWTFNGIQVETSDTKYNVYSKLFTPGKITLGANYGTIIGSMYSVILTNSKIDFEPPKPPMGLIINRVAGN